MLTDLSKQIAAGQTLSDEQVSAAVAQLTDSEVAPAVKADFLAALAARGETVAEIAAFARELRARAVTPKLDPATRKGEILDVCGTGGDRLHTFNISTTVAVVAAAASVAVAKHGNRAVTSHSGSADVLEALGIRIDLSPEAAARWLQVHRFAFFFAPNYHPAFRHIAPARRLCAERGQRTVFNLLGPLLNPARPTAQLIGVPRPAWCEPVARVLQTLDLRRGMVVSGAVSTASTTPPAEPAWLDELSTLGENTIAEFCHPLGLNVSTLSPTDFPVQQASLDDLLGADPAANAETVRRLLRGTERGPKRDQVLLNSAAALLVAGAAPSLTEGWELAARLIDQGQAYAKLEELLAASRTEPSPANREP